MTSRLTPHLHFHGTAREAMRFYAGIFGGDVDFHTFAEIGWWGDEFGACVDKFGVPWMVNIGRPA